MARTHEYETCDKGSGCFECLNFEKQQTILRLAKTVRIAPGGKVAALKILAQPIEKEVRR